LAPAKFPLANKLEWVGKIAGIEMKVVNKGQELVWFRPALAIFDGRDTLAISEIKQPGYVILAHAFVITKRLKAQADKGVCHLGGHLKPI